MAIKSVWIEEGCIVCNACDAECPEVFIVGDDTCMIRGEVRTDGTEDRNPGRVTLTAAAADFEAGIRAAASGCPVEVIQFEEA